MEIDLIKVVRAEVKRLSMEHVMSVYGLIPASINYLKDMFDNADTEEDREVLYTLLASECSKTGNDNLQVDMSRRCASVMLNDPIAQIGLAFKLAVVKPDLREESLAAAYKAVALSKVQGRWVRYSATNMARIAMILDDYEALEYSLAELIGAKGKDTLEDTGYEFDFVEKIDFSRCNPALLAQYCALAEGQF